MPADVSPSRRPRKSSGTSRSGGSQALGLPRASSVSFTTDPPAADKPKSSFSSQAAPAKPALKSARERYEEDRRAFYSCMPREVFPAVCDSPSKGRDAEGSAPGPAQPAPHGAPAVIGRAGPAAAAASSSASSATRGAACRVTRGSTSGTSDPPAGPSSSSSSSQQQQQRRRSSGGSEQKLGQELGEETSQARNTARARGQVQGHSSTQAQGLQEEHDLLASSSSSSSAAAADQRREPNVIPGLVATPFRAAAVAAPVRPPGLPRAPKHKHSDAATVAAAGTVAAPAANSDMRQPRRSSQEELAAAAAAAAAALRSKSGSSNRPLPELLQQRQQQLEQLEHEEELYRGRDGRQQWQSDTRQQQEQQYLEEQLYLQQQYEKHQQQQHQQQRQEPQGRHKQQQQLQQQQQEEELDASRHQQRDQDVPLRSQYQPQAQKDRGSRHGAPILAVAAAGAASAGALHEREVPYWDMQQQAAAANSGASGHHQSLHTYPPHGSSSHQLHAYDDHDYRYHQQQQQQQYHDSSRSTPTSDYQDAMEQPLHHHDPPLPSLRVHVPHSNVRAASDSSPEDHSGSYEALKKGLKGSNGSGANLTGGSGSEGGSLVPPGCNRPLPPLHEQLTLKALLVGLVVGFGYALFMQRLALVIGLVPGFQVSITLVCWLVLKGFAGLLGRDIPCLRQLHSQEVAVAAAAAYACANSIAVGGFGSVLLALKPITAAAAGLLALEHGSSQLSSFWAQVVWMLFVSFAGAFLAVAFRKHLLGAVPTMTFPTGTAAGALINVLHTPDMSYHGHKQMARFTQWSLISLLFSAYQWVFNSPRCNGFMRFPTFGLQALRYTWNFDFQLPLVGVGLMAPVAVAWSMLAGALAFWGVIWPLVWAKEGQWYPAGLQEWDPRGRYGYQLLVAGGLLLAEGLYQVLAACLGFVWSRCLSRRQRVSDDGSYDGHGGYGGGWGRRAGGASYYEEGEDEYHIRESSQEGNYTGGGWGRKTGGGYDDDVEQRRCSSSGGGSKQHVRVTIQRKGPLRRFRSSTKTKLHRWQEDVLRNLENDALSDASALQSGLAGVEATMRRFLFQADSTPAWLGLVGYFTLTGLTVAVLPLLLQGAGVLFYQLLAVAGAAALLALGNVCAAGLTDLSLTDTCLKLLVLLLAVWGAGFEGSAAAVGLLAGGWGLGVLVSANAMMYAYAAGYVTMANPTAVFASYMLGGLAGCVVGPFTLWFYSSVPGAVLQPAVGAPGHGLLPLENGMPAHMAPMLLAVAETGAFGFKLLPLNSVWVGVAAFAAGMVLRAAAAALPGRLKELVPKPAAVSAVAVLGANTAVGVALGCLVKLAWRWRYPRSAKAYAWVVGAALIAGEGIWALGRGLLTAFQVKPPICMSFALDT